MKSSPLKLILLLTTGAALTFTSCKKDSGSGSNSQNDSTAAALTAEQGKAEALNGDVMDLAINISADNNLNEPSTGSSDSSLPACAVVTVDPQTPNTFPRTVTVDFGAGCTAVNGITRKGKITYVFSDRLWMPGATVTVSFDQYFVNGYKLEGTHTLTNAINGNTIAFTSVIVNGKVTNPEGVYHIYNRNAMVTMTAGMGTLTPFDDEWSITGTGSIADSAGHTISTEVITPLVKKFACKNIVSGITKITYGSLTGTLDYGDGTCDNIATLKIGSLTKTVTLPR